VALSSGALALVLHLPRGAEPVPCVVACHGLRASKDSDKYLLLGEAFTAAGLALARFDFRGAGESEGLAEEDTTVASRVEDVLAVLAFLRHHASLDGRFGLLGSSMGGFVALHARHALAEPIPVVTWNAPVSLTELANDVSVEETGLGVAFAIEFSLGAYALAPRGLGRHLVIQAEADDVVPLEHGIVLHSHAVEPCDLVLIPGADHRLTNMEHRREAVARSLAWFQRFLPGDVGAAAAGRSGAAS
jgi:alpha-beta hydrolase superfamily lysophospholipase